MSHAEDLKPRQFERRIEWPPISAEKSAEKNLANRLDEALSRIVEIGAQLKEAESLCKNKNLLSKQLADLFVQAREDIKDRDDLLRAIKSKS